MAPEREHDELGDLWSLRRWEGVRTMVDEVVSAQSPVVSRLRSQDAVLYHQ